VASLERGDIREVKLMPIKVERTLFKIGEGGFAVTLPKAWIRYYGLQPGDKVEIIANKELTIRVKDKGSEGEEGEIDSSR
jgi:bifunctional DNA-binding transcriptional regulator/antitoxin component of YhaV-PrlF toxin-antitoxin module